MRSSRVHIGLGLLAAVGFAVYILVPVSESDPATLPVFHTRPELAVRAGTPLTTVVGMRSFAGFSRSSTLTAEERLRYANIEGGSRIKGGGGDGGRLGSMIIDPTLLEAVNDDRGVEIGVGPFIYPRFRLLAEGRDCPTDRFIHADTSSFGRHHNQLQELVNLIAYAHILNRTVVLGWSFAKKQETKYPWAPTGLWHDFSEIKKRYCVVDAGAMVKQLFHATMPLGRVTASCLGGTNSTSPFFTRHLGPQFLDVKCVPEKSVLDWYGSSVMCESMAYPNAMNFLFQGANGTNGNPHLVVLGSSLAFYLKPGILAVARVLRHLRPSRAVARTILEILSPVRCVGDDIHLPRVASAAFRNAIEVLPAMSVCGEKLTRSKLLPVLALHSRVREKDCPRELAHEEATMRRSPWLFSSIFRPAENPANFTKSGWDWARMQCGLNEELLRAIDATLPLDAQLSPVPTLLLSDGQSNPFSPPFRVKRGIQSPAAIRGAIKRSNEEVRQALAISDMAVADISGSDILDPAFIAAVDSVVVDFYIMTRSRFFSGNQLSSVSQNACLVRLGNGLSCDGLVPLYQLRQYRALGGSEYE